MKSDDRTTIATVRIARLFSAYRDPRVFSVSTQIKTNYLEAANLREPVILF